MHREMHAEHHVLRAEISSLQADLHNAKLMLDKEQGGGPGAPPRLPAPPPVPEDPLQMPASAPRGFFFWTPPNTQEVHKVTNQRDLVQLYPLIAETTMVNRPNVDGKSWKGPSRPPHNTKGYSSTYLAMGFANVRAGTWYPPEH